MPSYPQPDSADRPAGPEPVSFEAVFRLQYAGLCEFVTGYVRSPETAAELVHDLFLRIWELQGTPNAPPLTRAYLYTAARNRALRHLRHQRVEVRFQERATREASAPRDQSDEELHCRELIAAAERAIGELPERCRQVYTLSRRQNLSHAEIAEVLGIAVSTVENQMWRALKSLRAKLAPYLVVTAEVLLR